MNEKYTRTNSRRTTFRRNTRIKTRQPSSTLFTCLDSKIGSVENSCLKAFCVRLLNTTPSVLESLIELAVEIAREGREGRRIGTLFTLGDEEAVLAKSRVLILDPLAGHPQSARHVSDPNLRGTIKELAQLDGAFVVSHDGFVLSACRYLDAVASKVRGTAWSRKQTHRSRQHERGHKCGRRCRFRKCCRQAFLPRKAGRRNHSGALDDRQNQPATRYREERNFR